jgi:pimeloyl-ACP methyl ester carboxylesterase
LTEGRYWNFVALLLVLTMPLVSVGFHGFTPGFVVWVVNADVDDVDTGLAVRTLRVETAQAGFDVKETTLARLGSVPLRADVLVVVGHGEPDGLAVSESLRPWSELYRAIAERQPRKTIVIACYSPSDPSSEVFGFAGRVDAEAGALVVGWYLRQLTLPGKEVAFPLDRVACAQKGMLHPLGRYLYFIHGYWGLDAQFTNMWSDFSGHGLFKTDYESPRFFDYFEAYGATTQSEKDAIHWGCSISSFAYNLYDELRNLPSGSQVNIIGHSMGGLIAREMLRLYRTQLDSAGVSIGKVVTLGTPNYGTYLASPSNNWAFILSLIGGLLYSGTLWPSPVFWSMAPASCLFWALNSDPLNYSSGIEWCTVSGYDVIGSVLTLFIHGDVSDPIVARGRAHLSFATQAFFDVSHYLLIDDPSETTYDYIADWITAGPDSDSDNLTDDAETYYHQTDPHDSDTDNDGLSDYVEVVTWHTDPRDDNTDGDGLTDGYEVEHEYDALDINDPVPATLLISSVTLLESKGVVYVYVNHYTIMDYVDFYVRYKTAYGSWTTYSSKGRDYTPDTGGKYYALWTYPSGYSRMEVKVMAYDSSGLWLGTDYHTCEIGGGGPPPE